MDKTPTPYKASTSHANGLLKILLFLIYPFGGYLVALRFFKTKSSMIVIFLYFLVFGFAFSPDNQSLDSFRYIERYYSITLQTMGEFETFTEDYFSQESNTKDIFLTFSYALTSFFENFHFFFLWIAIIFGFFYIKSFSILVSNKNVKSTLPIIILLLWFGLSNPIFNINGVRFWTASWVAVFTMYQVFVKDKKWYLVLALLTPLIHGAYYVFLILLLLILFTRKVEKFWLPVFYFSLLGLGISFIDLAGFFTEYLPPFINNMLELYTSEEALSRGADTHIILKIVGKFPRIFVAILMFLIIKHKEEIKKDVISKNLYQIVLIWFSFVFFAFSIPSLGGRYFAVGTPLLIYLWINSYPILKRYNNIIVYGFPLFFFYEILTWFVRMGMVTGASFYYSPLFMIIKKSLGFDIGSFL